MIHVVMWGLSGINIYKIGTLGIVLFYFLYFWCSAIFQLYHGEGLFEISLSQKCIVVRGLSGMNPPMM
jgi:hypothetical protein